MESLLGCASHILLYTFDAYINMEICRSVKSVTHICKYMSKGSDRAAFTPKKTMEVANEVKLYNSSSYISSQKRYGGVLDTLSTRGIHCFSSLDGHSKNHHLENGYRVYFTSNNLQYSSIHHKPLFWLFLIYTNLILLLIQHPYTMKFLLTMCRKLISLNEESKAKVQTTGLELKRFCSAKSVYYTSK